MAHDLSGHRAAWLTNVPRRLAGPWGAALIATWVARWMHHFRRTFLVLDGLGLIAFTLIGCSIAREAGHALTMRLVTTQPRGGQVSGTKQPQFAPY